jgi:hypothetical protein
MVGFGVGIANKLSPIPNNWQVGCLDNVDNVIINIIQGTLIHNQIFSGDSTEASLFAIGPSENYSFLFDNVNASIRGGGNMILLENCLTNTCDTGSVKLFEEALQKGESSTSEYIKQLVQKTEDLILKTEDFLKQAYALLQKRDFSGGGLTVAPTVTSFAGMTNANVEAGILSSFDMLCDAVQPSQPVDVTPAALFAYLQVLPAVTYASPKSTIAQNLINQLTLGYIAGPTRTTIFRSHYNKIIGSGGNLVPPGNSLQRGDVNINIQDATGFINKVTEIPFGTVCRF